MPKHDRFHELCALASVGETSAQEQSELKAHLDTCPECRQEYREFVQLVLPQLSLATDVSPAEEPSPFERQAIRSRFLDHAQAAGIGFSESTFAARPAAEGPQAVPRRKPRWLEAAIAAGLLVAAIAGGYWSQRPGGRTAEVAIAPLRSIPPQPRPDQPAAVAPLSTKAETSSPIASNELQSRLDSVLIDLNQSRRMLNEADAEKTRLTTELKQKADRLATLEGDRENSKNAVAALEAQLEADRENSRQTIAGLRAKLEQQNAKTAVEQANFLSNQLKIRDLTNQLAALNTEIERDRQLMSVKGQNLMATRNLHIVDVFDSDAGGRVKGPSGRIFIVDEKHLIFYAYDLNEARLRDSKNAYQVWGQKEGPGHVAKALGSFASDDRSQRRWIFTCDDPKLLSQIDSVFVTIGPSGSPQPRGEKLMYAYLRGPVNHP